MKKIISLLIILSVCSCNSISSPKPFGIDNGMIDGAPNGTAGFRYGWKQGCESGMAAYGPMHYKLVYDYKYDPAALDDDEYQQAWELGFRHCRWYTSSWIS